MAMFTPNMTRWLARNVPGKTFDEAASVFNGRFGCEFTPRQIKGHCVYHGIKAGRKGRKGRGYKIGTECVTDKRSGFVYIKISDKPVKGCMGLSGEKKHFVIWESANGPVPPGHIVVFADRDKSNFDLGNLLLIGKREFFYMCRHGMLSGDPDVTKTNMLIARCHLAIVDGANKLTESTRHYSVKGKLRRWQKSSKQGRGGKNGE